MVRLWIAAVVAALAWLALLTAVTSPLLAAVQLIGLGLGGLVTVRIVQEWGRRH